MIGNDNRFTSAFGRAVLDPIELAAVTAKAVKAGFGVVLCQPGTKRPLCTLATPRTVALADKRAREAAKAAGVARWDKVRHDCGIAHVLTDPDKAKAIYVKAQARFDQPLNLAIRMDESRMVCVDVDTPEQLAAFWEESGLEPSSLTVASPGTRDAEGSWVHHDGGHIWFELPTPVVVGPGRGKYVGAGGWVAAWGKSYALVPPSVREEGPYTFVTPEIRMAPPFLLDLIMNQQEREASEVSGPKAPGDPADQWAAEVTWAELLERAEWTEAAKPDQCGCPVWTAPGGHDSPKSATAHEVGCPRTDTSTGHGPLHVWTDNPPEYLQGRRNWTKLQFVAAVEHGGNVAAAMRALGIASTLAPVQPLDPFDLGGGATDVNEDEGTTAAFTRIVDLDRWLEDGYTPPSPSAGAMRDDDKTMLYPGKWHTVIGQTTAGKTWFGLWHAVAVLEQGGTVAYAHFEEGDPGNTIHRLLQLGVAKDTIRKQFVWLSNDRVWQMGDMAAAMRTLDEEGRAPALLVLDGLIAGASRQGWKVNDAETVGLYRHTFVQGATAVGAAVISLGHPVKDRSRQDEIHGFGSTAWLDEVDGCSFRMEAGSTPIRKGHKGSSWVSVVKDRAGAVAEMCEVQEGKSEVWYKLGEFVMDDTTPEFGGTGDRHTTFVHLVAPRVPEEGEDGATAPDKIDLLGQQIITWLTDNGGRYETKGGLESGLRADGVKWHAEDLEPALIRLEAAGVIEREAFRKGFSRAGWLVDEGGHSK